MDQIKTGKFIAQLRKEQGLTQRELADKISVSDKAISKWETGKGSPDVSSMQPLCEALGISVTELLTGEKLTQEQYRVEAERNMFVLLRKKRTTQLVGAAITAAVMLFCVVWLYRAEFTIDISSTVGLEDAIKDYNFTTEHNVNILETERVGRSLFVLYENESVPGMYGFARLERGIFGEYRFLYSDNYNWPLYNFRVEKIGRKDCLILYSVNELSGVDSFAVYGDYHLTGEPFYTGKAIHSPGIEIVESKLSAKESGGVWFGNQIVYYTADGTQIGEQELLSQFSLPDSAFGSGTTSAETNLIYFVELIILAVGIVIIRFFLDDREKAPEQKKSEP